MKIYFIGIGGIGVSALARYYLKNGHKISGSDLVSSEITDALKEKGAKLLIGKHSPKNLPKDVDLIIYSPAVEPNNPELLKAKRLKSKIQYPTSNIQIQSYPEALGELTKKYYTIAVSGTHGKSTTTAMLGLLLIRAGLDPTVIVGTKLKEFGNTNFRLGGIPSSKFPALPAGRQVPSSKILVIEADEHKASFLNYWPKIIVLTTLEADHLDFYKNMNNILKTFKEYISHLPEDGVLVANRDDRNIKKMLITHFPTIAKNVLWYSLEQKESKRLKQILKIPGEHNVSNALAAITVARILNIPDDISFKSLSEYKGSWRRFEVLKKNLLLPKTEQQPSRDITVISDYGHHPTEILATMKGAVEKFPKRKIWCVFQPHQYQRTYYLLPKFVDAFQKLRDDLSIEKTIITDIYEVSGRETKTIRKKINSEKLVKKINRPSVIYLPKEKINDFLKDKLQGNEVVIIMGAGDIYLVANQLSQGK